MRIQLIIAITTTLLAGGALGSSGVFKNRKFLPSKPSPVVKKQPASGMAIGKIAFLFDDKMKTLCREEPNAEILCDCIKRLDLAVRDKSELFSNIDLMKLRSRLEKVLGKPALVRETTHIMSALEAIEILFTTGGGEDPKGQLHRIILGLALLIDHSLGESASSMCWTVYATMPRTYPPLLTLTTGTNIQQKKGSSSKQNGGVSGSEIAAGFEKSKRTGSLMVLKLLASFDARRSDHRTLYTSVLGKLVNTYENPEIPSQASNIELIKAVMAEPLRGLKETLQNLDILLSGGTLPTSEKETRNPSSSTAFRKPEVSDKYLLQEIYPKISAETKDFSGNNANKENLPKGMKKVTDTLNLQNPINRRKVLEM